MKDQSEVHFKVKMTTKMGKLKKSYSERQVDYFQKPKKLYLHFNLSKNSINKICTYLSSIINYNLFT